MTPIPKIASIRDWLGVRWNDSPPKTFAGSGRGFTPRSAKGVWPGGWSRTPRQKRSKIIIKLHYFCLTFASKTRPREPVLRNWMLVTKSHEKSQKVIFHAPLRDSGWVDARPLSRSPPNPSASMKSGCPARSRSYAARTVQAWGREPVPASGPDPVKPSPAFP